MNLKNLNKFKNGGAADGRYLIGRGKEEGFFFEIKGGNIGTARAVNINLISNGGRSQAVDSNAFVVRGYNQSSEAR